MASNFKYKKSEETRDAIFQAATKLINEKGFDKVTIRDIAAEANVTKSLFYYYFPSKEDIIKYTYQVADDFYEKAYEKAKDESAFDDMISVFLTESYANLQGFGKEIVRASLTNSLITSISQFMRGRTIISYLEPIYDRAVENEEIADMGFEVFRDKLLSFLVGVEFSWCVYDDGQSLLDRLRWGLSTFLYGLHSLK